MELIDGKATSKALKQEIKSEVAEFVAAGKRPPHLVAILVGEDGASKTYVKSKIRACGFVGFRSSEIIRPVSIREADLLAEVKACNEDPEIDGFIVQLPLPKHIDEHKIIQAIDPDKDVDGFHPVNIGKMVLNLPALLPATPSGIVELLLRYRIPLTGKHCVVIGRSHIVGAPTSILLSRSGGPGNCTVTLTHRHTPPSELKKLCRQADMIVVAVGIPGFLTGDMVKEGAVIIDVGITRVPAPERKRGYVIRGDVDFEAVAAKAAFITPVPGGVGPMTVCMLLKNTLTAYKKQLA